MSLTDEEVTTLIEVIKVLEAEQTITFPNPGEFLQLNAVSDDETNDKFIFDVNRKNVIKITKCTYQSRYQKNIILVRVDIDGPEHTNPDGTEVPCPHIHIYREGFGTSWAYPLEEKIITDTNDLLGVLVDFLRYNKVKNIGSYQFQGGGLV